MIKKILSVVLLSISGICIQSSAVVIQGEVSPGIYPNISVDSAGRLATTTSVSPMSGAFTDKSGTMSVGGTSQQVAASNSSRKYIFVENISTHNCYINFGVAAVTTQPSLLLLPNSSFVMEGSAITTQSVNINCSTTGDAYTAKEM